MQSRVSPPLVTGSPGWRTRYLGGAVARGALSTQPTHQRSSPTLTIRQPSLRRIHPPSNQLPPQRPERQNNSPVGHTSRSHQPAAAASASARSPRQIGAFTVGGTRQLASTCCAIATNAASRSVALLLDAESATAAVPPLGCRNRSRHTFKSASAAV